MKNKGFTLIELLVVIAIIGILASVVLAALNTSRTRAADAKIKSQLGSMRAQAQLYTGAGGPINTMNLIGFPACNSATAGDNVFFGPAGTNSFNDAKLFTGIVLTNARCASDQGLPSTGVRWAVAAQLPSGGAWCVDSSGVARDSFATGGKYPATLTSVILNNAPFCQ